MLAKIRSRVKLRALTLAEIVGVAALLIALLGYLDSHHDKVDQEKARAAAAAEKAAKGRFLLKGETADKGDVLRLASVSPDQVIQTQTLWFPKSVRTERIETTGAPKLEADWIADGLRKAAADKETRRVPVVVQTTYVQDGETKTDLALYILAFSLHSRLLQPDKVKLEGLSLATRTVKEDPQTAADKAWRKK